jgi:hypothetical protein
MLLSSTKGVAGFGKSESMLTKEPSLTSKLVAVGTLLFLGSLIVGFTIYMVLYFNEPETHITPDVSTNMDKGFVIGK